MLKLAVLVQIRQTIENEIPADEIDQVSGFLKILDKSVTTRQFRQP